MKQKTGVTGPRSRPLLKGESGQGTIEYILALVITVIVVLGILHQFSTAFRKYTDAFFDGYIACLLETGELPGNSTECQEDFKNFNMNDGKQLVAGSMSSSPVQGQPISPTSPTSKQGPVTGSTGSGGGGGGSGGSDGSGNRSELAGSGTGSSSSYAGSTGGSGFLKPRSTAVGKSEGESKEESSFGEADSLLGKGSSVRVGSGGGDAGKKTQLDRSFGYAGEEAQREREAGRPAVAQVKGQEEGDSLRPKRTIEKGDRSPSNLREKDDEGFSFGYLLRILLIIAIIIAIIVFFGSQLQQIWKSREK